MKQRLVGALVLLSLGVVLWSLLFTGNPMRSVDSNSQIPEPMRIDAEPPQAPARPAGVSDLSESWVPEPTEQQQQAESALPRDEEGNSAAVSAPQQETAEASQPEPETAPVAEAKPKAKAEPKPEAAPKPKPAPKPEPKPAKSSSESAGLDEQRILPKAWVVQVASFRSEASADGLKKKLQLRGYKAYVEKQSLSGRPLYRVLVGPKLNQIQAEKIRDEIETEFRLKGLVMRFKR